MIQVLDDKTINKIAAGEVVSVKVCHRPRRIGVLLVLEEGKLAEVILTHNYASGMLHGRLPNQLHTPTINEERALRHLRIATTSGVSQEDVGICHTWETFRSDVMGGHRLHTCPTTKTYSSGR